MNRALGLVGFFVGGVAVMAAGADSPTRSDDLVRTLVGPAGLGDRLWQRLQVGAPIAVLSASPDPANVSLVGAVRLDVPADTFVERFRQIEQIERGRSIRQIGRFSATPQLNDLSALRLDARDMDSLRDCRPGDCGLQLPADAIARLRAAVDQARRDGTNVDARVADEYRRFVIDLINDYRQHGLSSLDGYHDKAEPMSVGAAFDRLMARPGATATRVPELTSALKTYPHPQLAGADEFFYWSTVDFGLKPTLRVNHVVIYPVGVREDGLRYAIASKQIYASHYFDAALELRMVVADTARTADASFLVYSTDIRSRSLTGIVGGMLRGQVRSRARAALEHYLTTTKKAVETK